jgi:hypothetical protein
VLPYSFDRDFRPGPDVRNFPQVQGDSLEITARKLSAFLGAEHPGTAAHIALRIPSEEIKKRRDEHFVMLYHYVRGLDAASDPTRTDYWQLDSTPPEDRAKKSAQIPL